MPTAKQSKRRRPRRYERAMAALRNNSRKAPKARPISVSGFYDGLARAAAWLLRNGLDTGMPKDEVMDVLASLAKKSLRRGLTRPHRHRRGGSRR